MDNEDFNIFHWDDYEDYEEPEKVTCHYCQRKELHWELRDEKWKLCDNRGLHKCVPSKLQTVNLSTT